MRGSHDQSSRDQSCGEPGAEAALFPGALGPNALLGDANISLLTWKAAPQPPWVGQTPFIWVRESTLLLACEWLLNFTRYLGVVIRSSSFDLSVIS